jgi:hypothetical protein
MASLARDRRMTAKLSDISRELAAGLLREVGFEDRLTGWSMRQMSGSRQTFIYSLQEVAGFLKIPELDTSFSPGAGGSIGYVDMAELIRWIGDVFGDHALAGAIGEATSRAESYAQTLTEAKELIQQRLQQCEELLSRPT